MNFESTWNVGIQISDLKLRFIGGSSNNFSNFKISNNTVNPVFSGDVIKFNTQHPFIYIRGSNQILIQADIPLAANTGDAFHLEFVSASGVNPVSGQGYQASGTAIGNTFTIYQPPITNDSPTVSLAPNTVFGLTDNQCTSGCSYIGTILRFDAKNNPLSILKLALTFNGVDGSDFRNVKLLWGGNAYYNLYPTAANDAGQKPVYIEGNKIIFQNFSPYELTHANPNEILDLTIKFESNPIGVGKTIRMDLVNPLTDIIASNYETGSVLQVVGSAIGNAIFINKQ